MFRLTGPAATAGRLLFALAVLGLLLGPGVPAAGAQARRIEPNEIALTPADLPPGFTVVPEKTHSDVQGTIGVSYMVVMQRPVTPENLASGPIFVGQQILRVDQKVPFSGFLDEIRRRAIAEDGYALVPGAPNDGGTASLSKIEGQVAAYQVGFIKNDTIVFTTAIGAVKVISLASVLELAGISSARYDQALTQPAPLAAPTSGPSGAPASAPPSPVPSPSAAGPSNAAGSFKVEPDVQPIYQILTGLPDPLGKVFRELLPSTGVHIAFGPLAPKEGGRFSRRDNEILLNEVLRGEDPKALAPVLAHESTHALDVWTDPQGLRDCVGMEVRAHGIEASTHLAIWNGKPGPARTELERQNNALAQLWVTSGDPGLYRLVTETPGYQSQCDLWVPGAN